MRSVGGDGRARAASAAGSLYTWWRGDPVPDLRRPRGFRAEGTDDHELVARLSRLDPLQVRAWLDSSNRAYIACIGSEPAAYGWSASGPAYIGELGIGFSVLPGSRYLWDFATLPEWRGRSIYPLLLQYIAASEEADRFWIGHEPDNDASARGIRKAGFTHAGDLVALPTGGYGLLPSSPPDRSAACAALLGADLLPPETTQ